MGIEPTLFAWEAKVLPLNYTRVCKLLNQLSSIRSQISDRVYFKRCDCFDHPRSGEVPAAHSLAIGFELGITFGVPLQGRFHRRPD
jgi:hypothetical protein